MISHESRAIPAPREAALLLVVVMGLTLTVGYPLQAWSLIGGVFLTEWLLVATPVWLAIRLGRLSARSTLLLRCPPATSMIGATLAGASGWYVVGTLVESVQSRFLPIPPAVQEALRRLIAGSGRPLGLDMLALAVSPAICEELLFRGFVLRATERWWPPALVIGINAVAFAAFHLSIYRLLPTAVLGLVLATIAFRCRSIVPAMIFHLLNNGATLMAGRYLDAGGAGLPVTPLTVSVATLSLVGGLWLTLRAGAKSESSGRPRR